VVGGKSKERLYGAGQIAANYSIGNDSLKHQSSTSTCNSEDIHLLGQLPSQSFEANEELNRKFEAFQSLTIKFIPLEAQTLVQKQQSSQHNNIHHHNKSPHKGTIDKKNDQEQNHQKQNPQQPISPYYADY